MKCYQYDMSYSRIINVKSGQEGVRLDIWLRRQLKEISRARIQQLIRGGFVTINAHSVKESHKTKAGEKVEICIPPPQATELKPEPISLNILFEDDALIVIDKPSGMVVHPSRDHDSGTLANAVLHHCPGLKGIGGELRPGIVHRLDKNTSGVIVVAKTEAAIVSLALQFKQREIGKQYLAIVWGVLSPPNGAIKTLIGRHATDRKRMTTVSEKGRLAITRYETLEAFEKYSLVCLRPETGRTHQIRVHLAHLRHPVIGDTRYAGRLNHVLPLEVKRQMLHAHAICFRHPATGQDMKFSAPLPDDMMRLLRSLRSVKQSK